MSGFAGMSSHGSAIRGARWSSTSVSSRTWIGGLQPSGLVSANWLTRWSIGICASGWAAGYVNYRSMKAMRPLLSYLDQLGMAAGGRRGGRAGAGAAGALPGLLDQRARPDGGHRSLLPRRDPTCSLPAACGATNWTLAGLTAADVTGFVLAARPGRAPEHGEADRHHAAVSVDVPAHRRRDRDAVGHPRCPRWRGGGWPGCLARWSRSNCGDCWPSCDRRRRRGRRDYAILLLLSRLGLRAGRGSPRSGWTTSTGAPARLIVRGKANRAERLPLPVDVGEAIVAYLQSAHVQRLRQEPQRVRPREGPALGR